MNKNISLNLILKRHSKNLIIILLLGFMIYLQVTLSSCQKWFQDNYHETYKYLDSETIQSILTNGATEQKETFHLVEGVVNYSKNRTTEIKASTTKSARKREDLQQTEDVNKTILTNITKEQSNEQCEKGYFKVESMKKCHKWLSCDEITNSLTRMDKIGRGIGKEAYVVRWDDKNITFAMLKTRPVREESWIEERVKIGLNNLIHFQPSPYFNQLAGFCIRNKSTIIIVENCAKYGDLRSFYRSETFKQTSMKKRFEMVLDIINGFVELHTDKMGPRVHCDLHEIFQAMGQYLVTNDLRVVVNDIDEIPISDPTRNKTARCRYLHACEPSAFLAPEQQYTEENCLKNWPRGYIGMKKASPKSDVWKIPDFIKKILGLTNKHRSLKDEMTEFYANCKIINEEDRWNSTQVLKAFTKIYEKHFKNE